MVSMNLSLSAIEQERLAGTARALLSPLDDASVDRWRADVLARLTELLEADGAGFILPAADGPPYTLHDMPDAFARDFLHGAADDDAAVQALRREGGGVWCTRAIGERLGLRMPDEWFATDDYRSLYGRYDVRDAIGFMAFPDAGGTTPHLSEEEPTAAVLTCFRQVFGTELFGERGVAMLKLLLPALEAGVTTRVRLAGQARALEKAFEVARHGIAVHDLDGRRLYANGSFCRLIESDAAHDRLLAHVDAGVRTIAGLVRDGGRVPPESFAEASREVRTPRARYRVRLNLIGEGLFTRGPSVLITVEPVARRRPSESDLRERWRLTPREAHVALLLADGRTNRQIAATMELRPNTIRHYTEAVFLKLGVHTRAEATAKMLTG